MRAGRAEDSKGVVLLVRVRWQHRITVGRLGEQKHRPNVHKARPAGGLSGVELSPPLREPVAPAELVVGPHRIIVGAPPILASMPRRSVRLTVPGDELRSVFAEIRAELEIPESFPPEVLEEAVASAADPRVPDTDLTDVPFVTIDPPGSMDLDQALHLESRPDGGFRLRYAIADVAAFVRPGGAVDAEAHRRAETAYSPDMRSPLYPPVLSEAGASLLADGPRPAIVWNIDVDSDGEPVRVAVSRALVASRAQLDYPDVQAALDADTAEPMLALLPRIGRVLQEAERARGGSSLTVPRQEVVSTDAGYALAIEAPLPVEGWNAQLSLLTGRAAAELMLRGGVGVLRTMPPPYAPHVERLRRVAPGLGIAWPAEESYGELLQRLDAGRSTAEAVFLQEAAVLFQGASYEAFDGTSPKAPLHAAVAAPYAHATAPLRRLVDRYALEVSLAIASGAEVPAWVRDTLPRLPVEMRDGADRGNRLERAIVDAVEAAVLAPMIGREFDAVVVDVWKGGRGEVAIRSPAVIGPCDGATVLGASVRVRLEEADLPTRTIRFSQVGELRLTP
jgi:exoribonuclease R